MVKSAFLILISSLVLPLVSYGADDPPLADPAVTIEPDEITLEQHLSLTIVVPFADFDDPKSDRILIEGNDFRVVRTGPAESARPLSNGLLLSYKFKLYPMRSGELWTPRVTIERGSRVISAPPQQVVVRDNISSEDRLSVTQKVSPERVFLGEQIQVHISVRTWPGRIPFRIPSLDFPDFLTFPTTEEQSVDEDGETRSYITDLRFALFAKKSGIIEIPERKVTLDGVDGAGFSPAVRVEVLPLPEPAIDLHLWQASWRQVPVGATRLNGTVTMADKGALVTLSVESSGIIDHLGLPPLKTDDKSSFTLLESSQSVIDAEDRLLSVRNFTYLISGMDGGQAKTTLLPIKLSYFDPATAEYRTISTEPVEIEWPLESLKRDSSSESPFFFPFESQTAINALNVRSKIILLVIIGGASILLMTLFIRRERHTSRVKREIRHASSLKEVQAAFIKACCARLGSTPQTFHITEFRTLLRTTQLEPELYFEICDFIQQTETSGSFQVHHAAQEALKLYRRLLLYLNKKNDNLLFTLAN